MLRFFFCLSVCLCVFTLSSFAQLTPQDLKEIRSIVKEEIEKELTPIKADIVSMKADIMSMKADIMSMKADIMSMKADIVSMKEGFARLDARLTGVEKQIVMVANFVFALIALIVLAVGIPQLIMVWRSMKDRTSEKQNEMIGALTEEVETLRVKDRESEKQIAALIQKQNEMIGALTEEVETLRVKVLSLL